jgi:colicin import membrane protein
MRVSTYILSTVLLAGFAAAQTAPASQTVNSNSQSPEKPKTPAKAVVKSPFAPKAKVAVAGQGAKNQTAKPAQVQNGNKPKAPQPQAAGKPKQTPAVQTRAEAKPGKPTLPSQQQAKVQDKQQPKAAEKQQAKKEVAQKQEPKKPEPKKPEAKAAPVQAKAEPKKPEAKTAPAQAKAEAKPAEPEIKAAPAPPVAQNEPAKLPSPGKRDPFLSPLVAAGARNPSNCSTGKRCLVVDQIVLKGVVQMRNGNLALVENAGKRPYVLHENDSLFNGSVVKITGDSLILREESNDILGRPVSREVVKKVTAPAV